ncbi:hypothetical protein QJS66_23465 (plasmid) [Kocuria rhizophila]|nr:hypothetical protein QJS66_23465 [Kocuria rhizophila]
MVEEFGWRIERLRRGHPLPGRAPARCDEGGGPVLWRPGRWIRSASVWSTPARRCEECLGENRGLRAAVVDVGFWGHPADDAPGHQCVRFSRRRLHHHRGLRLGRPGAVRAPACARWGDKFSLRGAGTVA